MSFLHSIVLDIVILTQTETSYEKYSPAQIIFTASHKSFHLSLQTLLSKLKQLDQETQS